jgi:hypothetical protein
MRDAPKESSTTTSKNSKSAKLARPSKST